MALSRSDPRLPPALRDQPRAHQLAHLIRAHALVRPGAASSGGKGAGADHQHDVQRPQALKTAALDCSGMPSSAGQPPWPVAG